MDRIFTAAATRIAALAGQPAAFITALVVILLMQGCSIACGTEEASRADSPDGELTAVVHVRNCGATTDFNTNVSILEAGDDPGAPGNIFVAEAGGAPRTRLGGPDAQVRWLAPDRLLVTYDARAEVFLQTTRYRGIRIDYGN